MYLELLKYRFGVVLVHLFVICLAGDAYYQNVRAHLDFVDLRAQENVRNEMLKQKLDEFQTLYALSVVCVLWELVSVCSGLSTFSTIPSLCSIALNALGTIVTLWYCVDAWPSNYFVGIFLLFSLLPALIDAGYFGFFTCIHKATRVRWRSCFGRKGSEDKSRYEKVKTKDDDNDDDSESSDTPRQEEEDTKASSDEDTDESSDEEEEEKKRDDGDIDDTK